MHPIITVTLNPAIDVMDVNGRRYYFSGGKGINVARCLKRFKVPTKNIVVLGGSPGRRWQKLIAKENLPLFVILNKQPTRTNITYLDAQKNSIQRSMSPGGCADQNLALRVEAQLKKVVSRGQYVVMSGSLLPSLGADYYGHLIGIVRLKGGIPILDTSGKALLAGIRNKPFLIKPNQEEAQHCLEGKLNSNFSLIKAVQWFKEKGAENSIISLGKGGAVGMFDEVIHTCQLDNMGDNFGSTVGCGDVLLGCFLAQCRAGISRGEALRLSVAAATASMSFLKPGFFTRTQMIRHIASTGHKIMVAK